METLWKKTKLPLSIPFLALVVMDRFYSSQWETNYASIIFTYLFFVYFDMLNKKLKSKSQLAAAS